MARIGRPRTRGPDSKRRPPPTAIPISSIDELEKNPSALLTIRDLVELRLVPIYSTLMRWLNDGLFPSPIQLGERYLAWEGRIILGWYKHRKEVSSTAPERPGQRRIRNILERKRRPPARAAPSPLD
jgi:predicted DNA-binding transcriptional regulator AlpA